MKTNGQFQAKIRVVFHVQVYCIWQTSARIKRCLAKYHLKILLQNWKSNCNFLPAVWSSVWRRHFRRNDVPAVNQQPNNLTSINFSTTRKSCRSTDVLKTYSSQTFNVCWIQTINFSTLWFCPYQQSQFCTFMFFRFFGPCPK